MAIAGLTPFRAVRTLAGTPIPQESVPETASQTFKRGALVVVTSGYLVECAADPALIFGVATRDGQNGAANGSKKQTVELAHPDTLFVGNLDTSASEGNGTTAATDRQVAYGVFKRSAGGKWSVDKSDTTNKRVRVWNFWEEDTVGDTLGRVIFAFVQANFQGHLAT